MEKPRILLDADSFPHSARHLVQKAGRRLNINVIYFANRNIPFEYNSDLFEMRICENEKDAADDMIVNECKENDIVLTRDILLAKRIVEKNYTVINDRGTLFTKDNIPRYLEQREENLMFSELKITSGGKKDAYGKKELHDFACCFDRVMTEHISKL